MKKNKCKNSEEEEEEKGQEEGGVGRGEGGEEKGEEEEMVIHGSRGHNHEVMARKKRLFNGTRGRRC